LRSLEADALEAVVITEGPADAITAALALDGVERVAVIGVPGASNWRDEWAEYVEGLSVVICRDDDSAGESFAQKVGESLSSAATAVTPPAHDLSDLLIRSGLDAVRGLLLDALDEVAPGEVVESDDERALRLVFEAFPGSQLVEEVSA
jgi:DNA primase